MSSVPPTLLFRPLRDDDELHRSFLVARADAPAFEQLFLGKPDEEFPRYLAVDVRFSDWQPDASLYLALVIYQPAPNSITSSEPSPAPSLAVPPLSG